MRVFPSLFLLATLFSGACAPEIPPIGEFDGPNAGDDAIDPGFGDPADPCDGFDNNGDGRVDEGCLCNPGDVQECYPGDPALLGVGVCQGGVQECVEPRGDFWQGRWSACADAVLPTAEICGNAVDEDCDGYVAPCQDGDVTGLPCHPGATERCYIGPPETQGYGMCAAGERNCGEGDVWGPCEGSVIPAEEVCGNAVDEDCDGVALDC